MIPDLPHRCDSDLGFEKLKLFTQKGNIYLHVVILGFGKIAPDLCNDVVLRKDLVRVGHEQLKYFEFLIADVYGFAVAGKGICVQVKQKIPEGELINNDIAGAARKRTHPGKQFVL